MRMDPVLTGCASTPTCGERSVGGATSNLDLCPHESLVGDDDLQVGRLSHDRRVPALTKHSAS